jgi:hypothetical protein
MHLISKQLIPSCQTIRSRGQKCAVDGQKVGAKEERVMCAREERTNAETGAKLVLLSSGLQHQVANTCSQNGNVRVDVERRRGAGEW